MFGTRRNLLERLMWWQLDESELETQVAEYDTLGFMKSARRLSAALCGLTVVVTLLLGHYIGLSGPAIAVEIVCWSGLALAMWHGHRWAFLAAMALWSVEKLLALMGGTVGARSGLSQLIWWALYMRVFYVGYHVAKRRAAETPPADPPARDTARQPMRQPMRPPTATHAPAPLGGDRAPAAAPVLGPQQRRCPSCDGVIARQAVFCRHCLKSVSPIDSAA